MSFFKKYSLAVWLQQLGGACRRFPIAVLLLAFLSCFFLCLNHGSMGKVDEKWQFFYIFYPATGALLAVSLQLLTEDFKSRIAAVATQVVIHAGWLGVSLYLAQFEHFSMPQLVAVAATVVTMALSLFLACFYHKDDDVAFWNFSQRTLVALVAGIVVGGVLTLGIILFVQSLDWLFGMTVKDSVFADVPSVCLVLVAPLLTMSQIPQGDDKWDRAVVDYSGFIKGVAQYLFIPLLLLYLVTLYVYAAKILFSWQLPVGWVSYLVSASMLGMVLLLFVTFPVQHEQGASVFKTMMRWLPLVMLPLLALMSVAIGRRLSDYGITVSRLYVLVFNIWCYVVCLGLLLCRNRRIWWVPATFAVVLFVASVGPQSIPNVTQRHLLGQARSAFRASGYNRFPLTGGQYDRWLKTADPRDVASIDAKLHYLTVYYGYDHISSVLGKDAVVGAVRNDRRSPGKVEAMLIHYDNRGLVNDVRLQQAVSRITAVSSEEFGMVDGKDQVVWVTLSDAQSAVEYRFELNVKQLVERDRQRNQDGATPPLLLSNGDHTLLVDEFSLTLQGDAVSFLRVGGLLLTQ